MIAVDDTVAIFQSIVCSTQIDWSQCREAAFDCFSTFFGLLDVGAQIAQSHTDSSPSIALDALWRIALLIDVPTAMHSSINLLLQTYAGILFCDPEAYSGMLKIIRVRSSVGGCRSVRLYYHRWRRRRTASQSLRPHPVRCIGQVQRTCRPLTCDPWLHVSLSSGGPLPTNTHVL